MRYRLLLVGLLSACAEEPVHYLDGGTTVPVDMAMAADTTPPTFAGASGAASAPNSITVSWSAASDNVTPASGITYLVYQATTAGGENFATPTYTTPAGATSFSIGKLPINSTYYFVVRAKDAAGNVDANKAEVKATTPATSDMQAPTFSGLASASASGTSVNLAWTAATDNVSAASSIVYLVYQSPTAGGENYASPTYTTVAGSTSYAITNLTPGNPYYFVVRAQDQAGNIDTNKVEKSATVTAPSLANNVQPIFTANCLTNACHAGANPAQGLALTSASVSYANMVNIASSQCPTVKRVLPGQPTMSYLIWKLQGSGACFSGSRMPKGAPLTAAEIATVSGWISAGAPNN